MYMYLTYFQSRHSVFIKRKRQRANDERIVSCFFA